MYLFLIMVNFERSASTTYSYWVLDFFLHGVKWLRYEANYTSPSSAEVKCVC
jgi:hypothetical protein